VFNYYIFISKAGHEKIKVCNVIEEFSFKEACGRKMKCHADKMDDEKWARERNGIINLRDID
jgi:hypothetical protein